MTSSDRNIGDPVLAFIRQACSRPGNRFGPEFVPDHLLLVERFALQLAETLGADRTVVRAAALLHDIAAIEDFARVPVHANVGAKRVVELCGPSGPLAAAFGLDASQVERTAKCVREHSSPQHLGETIPESVCVSNGDAISQIVRPFYWFHYARTLKQLSYADALAWYRSLVEHNWSELVDAARPMIAREHEAVTVLFH